MHIAVLSTWEGTIKVKLPNGTFCCGVNEQERIDINYSVQTDTLAISSLQYHIKVPNVLFKIQTNLNSVDGRHLVSTELTRLFAALDAIHDLLHAGGHNAELVQILGVALGHLSRSRRM